MNRTLLEPTLFVLPASLLHRRALSSASAPLSFAHLLCERSCAPAANDTEGTEAPELAMDMRESDTAYSVILDLPGVAKDQLTVCVEGRRVGVATIAAAASQEDATRVLYRERSAPAYVRTVVLPAEVGAAATQARFENGVPTLTLAKRVASGATQIKID